MEFYSDWGVEDMATSRGSARRSKQQAKLVSHQLVPLRNNRTSEIHTPFDHTKSLCDIHKLVFCVLKLNSIVATGLFDHMAQFYLSISSTFVFALNDLS